MSDSDRTLILSQDYELFFKDSGSAERCLFEPCNALVEFARPYGLKYTFFVDAGMLLAMERISAQESRIAKDLARIKRHIGELAADGHEIALHIHPHWEDTIFDDNGWQFENTRYQLRDFSEEEIVRIVRSYTNCLGELSGAMPTSYRAGGFCLEPFGPLGAALRQVGIKIDSSVVPGARLIDQDKGFDFANAPDKPCWRFEDSPATPNSSGRFIEIPVTPLRLSPIFYWFRAIDRLTARRPKRHFGDGLSKAIGRQEALRRLTARSRVSELSMDDAKAGHLLEPQVVNGNRSVWHVMGHPKLASQRAFEVVKNFIDELSFSRFESVTSFASDRSEGS